VVTTGTACGPAKGSVGFGLAADGGVAEVEAVEPDAVPTAGVEPVPSAGLTVPDAPAPCVPAFDVPTAGVAPASEAGVVDAGSADAPEGGATGSGARRPNLEPASAPARDGKPAACPMPQM
jgi:hypothetical protein